jgi:hypothetical protein
MFRDYGKTLIKQTNIYSKMLMNESIVLCSWLNN